MDDNKFGLNVRTYRNVLIRNSEIKDNVLIADDSFITGCKIDENVIVERRNMLFDSYICAYSGTGYNDVIKKAEIGKYCSISWNCTIGGDEHFIHRLTTSFFPLHPRSGFTKEMSPDIEQAVAEPLNIGSDVWIGANVVVTRGLSIGCGVVLGGGYNCD